MGPGANEGMVALEPFAIQERVGLRPRGHLLRASKFSRKHLAIAQRLFKPERPTCRSLFRHVDCAQINLKAEANRRVAPIGIHA